MTWTSVPDRAIGYAPVEADWDTSIRDNLNVGAWVVLASTKLTVAAASFDFTSITATFAHLRVVLYGRGDTAAVNTNVLLRFNNDSGANYDQQGLAGTAATAGAAEAFAQTSLALAAMGAGTAPGNLFSGADYLIPHYANAANNKCVIASNSLKYGTTTTTLQVNRGSGFWRSNSAVNRVTLLPAAGNFAAGSACALLALP